MPTIPKSKRPSYLPKRVKVLSSSQKADQSFYNSKAWRNYSIRYRTTCEICLSLGMQVDITSGAIGTRGVVDHIVPMQQGGSPWDEANHMGMCGSHHNTKRGMESQGYCVRTTQGVEGLIPKDREEVIERLTRGHRAPDDDVTGQGGGAYHS